MGAAAVLAARGRGLGEGGVGRKDYSSQQAFRPERLLWCWGSPRCMLGVVVRYMYPVCIYPGISFLLLVNVHFVSNGL